MKEKATRNEILFWATFQAILIAIVSRAVELDPWHFFWFGLGCAYLNAEFWVRFWRWWEQQPPFKGFQYWIDFSFKKLKTSPQREV